MKGLVYHGPGQKSWDTVPDPTHRGADGHRRPHRLVDDLRHRPAHPQGRRPDVPAGHDPRPRSRRHDRREGQRRDDPRGRRPRSRLVHHVVRPLPVLQGAPLRPVHRRRRLDLRPPDQRPPGRVRARAVRRHVRLQDPGELDDEQVLFLADILPTAYEVGVLNGRVEPGDTVAIVGAGPIGLAAIMTAGLYTPAASSRSTSTTPGSAGARVRRRRDDQQRPRATAVAEVMELTGGLGADVAIEAVGVPETFELCTELVRPGGRVANVGVHGHSATLHLEKLWIRDVTITTGLVDTYTTPRLLELIAEGQLNALPFATHHFPLDEMMARTTRSASAKTQALKVVLEAEPIDDKPMRTARSRLSVPSSHCAGRRGGRDPPRRLDAAAEGARTRRRGRPRRVLRGALRTAACYLRFHGMRHVDAALVEHFLDPDWVDRGALVGVARRRRRRERIVAVAEFARLRDPAAAEVAFTVADELQGRGVGTRLLEQLAARAAEAGIESFVAEVLPDNAPMLARLPRRGLRGLAHARRRRGRGALPDRADRAVPRTRRGARPRRRRRVAAAVLRAGDRRGHRRVEAARLDRRRAVPQHPRRRLRRRRVSRQPRRRGGRRRARLHDDRARSPSRSISRSSACRASACSRRRRRRCARASARSASSPPGSPRSARRAPSGRTQLLSLVRAHGARLVGPNCLGIAVPALGLNATFAPRALPPGPHRASRRRAARSGSRCSRRRRSAASASRRSSRSATRPTSRRTTCSSGGRRTRTPTSSCSISSRSATRRSSRGSRGRVARRKPIVALKAGTSSAGARAASSHTAALAGSDAAVEALFRQAGVLRARNLEELVDVATLLSSQPLPKGRRVAVLTNAGGLGILCADACDAAGLELPELTRRDAAGARRRAAGEASVANPVDLLGSATASDVCGGAPARPARSGDRRA